MSNIQEQETMWFPGIYGGRTGPEWTQLVLDMSEDEVIPLIQRRATEDGEWCIANGFVGDNEDKMRRMMAWVSDETNIRQALASAQKENGRTVDWVCRDLANGSKWVVR